MPDARGERWRRPWDAFQSRCFSGAVRSHRPAGAVWLHRPWGGSVAGLHPGVDEVAPPLLC
eukprot:13946621-Alexandrium_andersonii.AAC.1